MSAVKKTKISLGSFDFIKGFAMILVILCHSTNSYDTSQPGIFSFLIKILQFPGMGLMPLFFIISGYGFKVKKAGVMLKKSFQDLVIPHLWVMLAVALVFPIVNYPVYDNWPESFYMTICYVLSFLLGTANGGNFLGFELIWCSVTWYLLATFVAFNILNLILKIKRSIIQVICTVLCIITGHILFTLGFYYFCIPQGLFAVGYCYIGHILKKHKLFERFLNSVWAYCILLPITIVGVIWGYMDLSGGIYNNLLFDYILSACSGLFYMLLGFLLGQLDWKCLDWIKNVGIYTYWIVCVHSFEVVCMPWSLLTGWLGNLLLVIIANTILRSVFIAVTCYCLMRFAKYRYRRRLIRK